MTRKQQSITKVRPAGPDRRHWLQRQSALTCLALLRQICGSTLHAVPAGTCLLCKFAATQYRGIEPPA